MSGIRVGRYLARGAVVFAWLLAITMIVTVPYGHAEEPPGAQPGVGTGGGDETPFSEALYMPGEIVVKLVDIDSVSINEINATFGTSVAQYLSQLKIFLLNAPFGADLEQLAASMEQHPFVATAHPNYLVDPLQAVQGSFPFGDEDFAGDFDGQQAASTLRLPEVHAINSGAGVTIGVIDGGVNYNHPVFGGAVQSGFDYVDFDTDAFDEEGGANSGHGTFVAGVIHLVAPESIIRAYRVSDPEGKSDGYLVAEAILQAVEDGCRVINLSMVMTQEHSALRDALEYARDHDVVVIAAAGNGSSEEPTYPASDPNTICVAAVDSLNRLASFSRYGVNIDLCAPGTGIYAPYLDTGYAWWGGTSFAAPFASAQAALIISQHPSLHSFLRTRQILITSADNIDDINPLYAGKLGAGLIDPEAALSLNDTLAIAYVIPDTLVFTLQEGTVYFAAPRLGATLMSSNAPAAYFGEIIDSGLVFAYLEDSVGVTNDSVIVMVDAGVSPAGTYYNTIAFHVEGVDQPAYLTVRMDVISNPGAGLADVIPDTVFLTVPRGTQGPLLTCVQLNSTNAPAAYVVQPGYLTQPVDSSGFTNDSVCLMIYPERAGAATLYVDTVVFHVQGVTEPVILTVWLQLSGGVGLSPQYLSFQARAGTEIAFHGCALLTSANPPEAYTGEVLDGGRFTTLLNPTGVTGDSVCVIVDPNLLAPGVYADTVIFTVAGNPQPAVLPVYLTILDSLPPSSDSAWVIPNILDFFISPLSMRPQSTLGQVSLFSTNAPAAYFGYVVDTGLVFSAVIDSAGLTNTSVRIEVFPGSLPPGVYYNMIRFDVEGAKAPTFLAVRMSIDSTGVAEDTGWVYPTSMAFQTVEGSFASQVGCVVVLSGNQPAPFTAGILDTADFASLFTNAGTTPDSVCFGVDAGTLSPGQYKDTVVFIIEGVTNNPLMTEVTLTVLPDTLNTPPPLVATRIGLVEGPGGIGIAPGTVADVSVDMEYTDSARYPIGGYDLLIGYESAALSFVDAQPGQFLEDCGWEYFSFSGDFDTSCGTCPSGLLRVVGVAEIVNGSANHPSCLVSGDSASTAQLASIKFLVSADTCVFSPIGFYWIDCGDNAIASTNGDTLLISRHVYDVSGLNIEDPGATGPTPFGANASCESPVTIRTVDFHNGGVRIQCGDTVIVPTDSAVVIPDTLYFSWVEGNTTTQILSGCAMLWSTNAPAHYTAIKDTDLVFVALQDTAGMTNDSVCVYVNPAGMIAGRYDGFVRYQVDGVDNPVYLTISLTVTADSLPGNTAWFSPDTLYYSAPAGAEIAFTGVAVLNSTNAPAIWWMLQDSLNPATLPLTTSGVTPDSVRFEINPGILPPGVYYETWWGQVDGCAATAPITICMTVTDSGGGSASATLTPSALDFTLMAGDTIVACTFVSSSNAPADYYAYLATNPWNFTHLVDSVGQTNDSLCMYVTPGALPPGIYVDTIVVSVAGVTQDAFLYVRLTIPAGDSVFVTQNYPNPFNPTTEIRFTLPEAAEVKLEIFNVMGQRVTTLADEYREAGNHSISWNAAGYASGIYLYRITAGRFIETRKMVLMK